AGVTQDLNARSFRTFEFFAIAAVLYYLIAKAVMLGARLLAWRLFRY
ncbi:MAG: amino acid ABC transporter permease, partial [Mangrovicoccus sp.]|nr:amino acid ABC transporter permease [Mangrovicoccus sp.]